MIIKRGYILQNGIRKRDIRIEGNEITEIGKDLKGSDTIDASHHLVMPGFVNTHTHLAMTLLRGYADDVPLQEWLKDIWPKEMKLTPQDCYYGNLLGIIEMIKSGTTCFNDMYFYEDQAVNAVKESGIRAVLSAGMADMGNLKRAEFQLKKSVEFAQRVKKEHLVKAAFGPHSPYACSFDFLSRIQEQAQKLEIPVHIHLHETAEEIRQFKKRYGKTPIVMLDSIGFLASNICAAHVVHTTDKELDILKTCNVKVLHCPSSNLKLANGIAPVAQMVKKGICVSLGTDGAASNNTQDLCAEMRLMALLQKIENPGAMNAETAVKIATENGGYTLDWNIGRIEEGFLADVIFIDLKKVCMVPRHNLISNIVYSMNSSAVNTVIINGKVIMENRKILTVDEGDVIEKAREHAYDLVNR